MIPIKIKQINPYKVYTVCNDLVRDKRGHNRNYSAAIYLDHLFNGLTEERHIRFSNGFDRIVFTSPVVVTDSNEAFPAVRYNDGKEILISRKPVGIVGGDIVEDRFDVIHVSTLNSVTRNVTPRVLCIGDSITYGELAEVNADDHRQNWAYHLMCSEFFAKDDIDGGGGYGCVFLGHYKRSRQMTYGRHTRDIVTHHEGIRGISLSSYLNGGVDDFRSPETGRFSINAWLERYRTMDDLGNRLELGKGTGSLISADNIGDIDVCTPTHVVILLGANGGGTIEQYRELVGIIKTEYPDIVIGIAVSDSAGTYFPSLHRNCSEKMTIWNDTGDQGSRHEQQFGLAKMLSDEFGNDGSEARSVYFLPFYFVQPTAESFSMRRADLPDSCISSTLDNSFCEAYGWHASSHVNGVGHTHWGYQLYAWLKYTIARGLVPNDNI